MPKQHQQRQDLSALTGVPVQRFDFEGRFKEIRETSRELARAIDNYHQGKGSENTLLNKSFTLADLITSTPKLTEAIYTDGTVDGKFARLDTAFAATYVCLDILNNLHLGHADMCLEGISPVMSNYWSVKEEVLKLVQSSATFLANVILSAERSPSAEAPSTTDPRRYLTGNVRAADLVDWHRTLEFEKRA